MLEICKRGRIQAVATQQILREAERNILLKFNQEVLLRFYRDIAETDLSLVEPPSPEAIASYSDIIHSKDAHVLAAAIQSKAAILITLDRKHFMTKAIREANLSINVQTPADFLRQWIG